MVDRHERDRHAQARREARATLDADIERRCRELAERQTAERDEVARMEWRGNGGARDAMVPGVAKHHKSQREALQVGIAAARAELREAFPDWPDYPACLISMRSR